MPCSKISSANCRSAGQWHRPDHHGVDAEHLRVCRLQIMRRTAKSPDDRQHAVGVHPFGGVRAAADLVQQGGGRAAVSGIVPMPDREVLTHDVLNAGTAGRQHA